MKTFLLICGLLMPGLADAQNYAISFFTIDGGGGTSSGGSYSLSGGIGQPDAGKMSGGQYLLEGGFWNAAIAVPTAGSVMLNIRSSVNSFIISWPVRETALRLESNSNLSTTNAWQNVSQMASTNNGMISITVPATPGNTFFRLRTP
jgi:hypothetical protein